MAFVSKKIIAGKERYYLEKSVRINGKIKKYSLYLKGPPHSKNIPPEFLRKLEEKINQDILKEAVASYTQNYIFTEAALHKIEEFKLYYQAIIKQFTPAQLNDLLDRFAVNFTYESNAIEGNSLTLKDVTFIIKEGKVLPGKDLREVYETLNTRKALEWILRKKPKVSERNILHLHKLVVENTGITLGYKQFPNFLLGRRVETTPPEKVKEEMQKLLSWYESSQAIHPLQRAALFHGKLEKIHPFEDGNGRVGRLLINLMLLTEGYPPLIIRKTQRVSYFHALDAFDRGHADNFYYFLMEKYKDTSEKFFKIYVKYLKY